MTIHVHSLTHWCIHSIAAILQTTFSNAFSVLYQNFAWHHPNNITYILLKKCTCPKHNFTCPEWELAHKLATHWFSLKKHWNFYSNSRETCFPSINLQHVSIGSITDFVSIRQQAITTNFPVCQYWVIISNTLKLTWNGHKFADTFTNTFICI